MSSFITTDATQDVFDLVLARPVVSDAEEHPWLVHLWWLAPLQDDRLVQIYVQGELYDVTLDPAVREICLVLDRTRQQRIELLAIPGDDPQAVWRAQPDLLGSWEPAISSTAEVVLMRDEMLPADTQLVVEVDGQGLDHGAMWPEDQNRSGFGNPLGQDDGAGLGVGVGGLGVGPLGGDGTVWRWCKDGLDAGSHQITINAVNLVGLSVAGPVSIEDVLIERLPSPVSGLTIDPSFHLSWALV